MNAKRKRTKKRGNPLGVIVGVVLVVALVLVVGEIALRMFLGKEISDGFREAEQSRGAVVSEDVQTSFGSNPVLLALLTSELGGMNLGPRRRCRSPTRARKTARRRSSAPPPPT